jgi:phage/plasmid primase-like uncharacterized protein
MSNNKVYSFFGYVLAYYRNDPVRILEKFASEIAEKAAEVSIDWRSSAENVVLTGEIVKGRRVVGLSPNDAGRVSITASVLRYTQKKGDVVCYPFIRFQNFRKHFSEPVYWDGYKAMLAEWKELQQGQRVSVKKIDMAAVVERQNQVAADQAREKQFQLEAVQKDFSWLQKLQKLKNPCPYFSRKGLPDMHAMANLYSGETTVGVVGTFTALVLEDIDGDFRGLQRIYFDGTKRFRKGVDPSCCFWRVGDLVDGHPIVVTEGAANAGWGHKLTGFSAVATLFADNLVNVVLLLRERYANSQILIVADNDVGDGPNKGVSVAKEACQLINNENVVLVIPEFPPSDKKLTDLADYAAVFGPDEAKKMVLSTGSVNKCVGEMV